MSAKSYFDEFKQNYEKPQVDGLIVGFSGIDPQRKSSASGSGGSSCNCDNSTLSDAQKEIVLNLIQESLSVTDFSNCNCDPSQLSDAQKNIIYQLIQDKLDELSLSNYDDSNLPEGQKEIVRTIINERLQDFTINYDGGKIDENDEHEPMPAYEPVDESNLNHEKLQGLQGGNSNGHFHLDYNELTKLRIMIHTFFPDGSDNPMIIPVNAAAT